MKNLKILLFLFFTVLAKLTYAQSTIEGKVMDDKSVLLPGVSVIVKGTTNGTITGINGDYSLQVSEQAKFLIFSFVGMKQQEIEIADKTNIDVTMQEEFIGLDEVVAFGYLTERKRDLTGSVGIVNFEELTVPVAGIDQAIQGKIAGVNIIGNGSPGADVSIRIRGIGTVGDNNPLYIIDGVPSKSGINMVNPSDIESFQVLKDASSAAIYGSRASNGVIIITTKKGKSDKAKISFDAYCGIQSTFKNRFPDMVTPQELADLTFAAAENGGSTPPSIYGTGSTPVLPDYIDADQIVLANKNGTDWFDEIFDPGFIQNYNFMISKGDAKEYHALSLSYFNQEGSIIKNNYERITTRINTGFSALDDKLKIGNNLSIAFSEREGGSSNILSAYNMPTIVPVYDLEGDFAGPETGLGDARNPVAAAYSDKDNTDKKFKLLGNVFAELELVNNLFVKTSLGIDYSNNNIFTYTPAYEEGSVTINPESSMTEAEETETSWVWSTTARYTKQFEDHKITALAGFEYINTNVDYLGGYAYNFVSSDIDYIHMDAALGNTGVNESGYSNSLRSFFGKINYDYRNKYLLSFTARNDGSSKFASNNREAFFTAVSGGWNVSQEDFFKSKLINNLKLRVGWGQNGNQEIDNYMYSNLYSVNSDYSNYDIDGANTATNSGIILYNKGNEDIQWETTTQTNIGIDFDLDLGTNILSGSVDYFNKKTSDMLVQVNTSATSGQAEDPYENVGEVENKGFEINMGFKSNPAKPFRFEAALNLSIIENEVTDIKKNDLMGAVYRNQQVTITREGEEISSFYGHVIEGIFQNEGEVSSHADQGFTNSSDGVGHFKYKDINEDNVIDDEDRTIIGSPHPDLTAGLTLNTFYKNFDFSMFLYGSFGQDVYNYVRYETELMFDQFGKSKSALDYWSPQNTDASRPIATTNNSNDEKRPSTFFVEDGSYLRIQNIQVGYTFPKALSQKLFKVDHLRIYAQAQNLHTFTDYSGLDPEVGLHSESQDLDIGVDRGTVYPNPTTIMFGVNVNF